MVSNYHHPEKKPVPPREEDRGGFFHPFSLVVDGWQEHKATGVYPDPEELSKRIRSRFKGDIDYFDELIERGRPKPVPYDNLLKPEQ